MGHIHKHECRTRSCNTSLETQKKPPTFYPRSPSLFIVRSDTQSCMPQSLSTLSGKDVACKYKSLLAYEKPHCRRQHIPRMMNPVYLGSKRHNLFCKSTDKFCNSSFLSRFSAYIINKFYSWASNNELWV